MRLPIFKRINRNDYPDEFKPLVDLLSVSLNIGIELLYTVLDKRVSLKDNILCDVKDIQVTADENGIPSFPVNVTISNQNITNVLGLNVILATNLTNSVSYPTGGIFITYTQTQSQSQTPTQAQIQQQNVSPFTIQINHVTGLIPDNNYSLRVVIYG